MGPVKFNSINALEDNPTDIYFESTEILLRIAKNVLNEPLNAKFRSISLKSNIFTKKLLPVHGALDCLFEMGFKKGEDNLSLSPQTSLDSIKHIHDELIKRREKKKLAGRSESVSETKKLENEIKISNITEDLNALQNTTSNSFLKKILFWCFYILKYEDIDLQEKALRCIPLTEFNLNVMKNIRKIQLECKKKNIAEENIDCQELLLVELCNWFNNEFFTWVDSPQCKSCGFIDTVYKGMSYDVVPGADRVEEYNCPKCNNSVLFPRYNNPSKLLETRKGRCGEWANCFCLFCRSLGWDSRLVFDETDHVWVEVYSIVKSKWIHCDPCENAVDTPLMYECGWKKNLSYVIAYSLDDIQDVTWRYSSNHAKVLKNRVKCSEQELVNFIVKIRNMLLNHATEVRKKYVLLRTVLELVDLMKENSAIESEEKGRISGSLSWRLLRGETSTDDLDFKPYTWTIDKDDEKHKIFKLSYVTAKDIYIKNSKCVLKTWKAGVYRVKSMFKKDEKDWKMSYLARQEGSERGLVSWKFVTGEKFSIDKIDLKLICQTYENGVVTTKLCSGLRSVVVPSDSQVFSTNNFTGLKSVELIVELFGGNFWQHSQILRQSFTSEESAFEITITLLEN